MHIISERNVNGALSSALCLIANQGVTSSSRNGPVMVLQEPVTTVYAKPTERVLFSPKRDANPFFHFMEGLWMLAGRNDVAFPLFFNSRFGEYSDDGVVLNGAYGHRWRQHFGRDQLVSIVNELRRIPDSRRAVLSMWDARHDLGPVAQCSKDLPCNTHIYFDCRGGVLNMLVSCRSNDALWGAYGANAVHMSMLMECMASWIGVPVGVYRQMSNNLHIYTGVLTENAMAELAWDASEWDLYDKMRACTTPMVEHQSMDYWLHDLAIFLNDPLCSKNVYANDVFFGGIATPIFRAWDVRKAGKPELSYDIASTIESQDWRIACQTWINRRAHKS